MEIKIVKSHPNSKPIKVITVDLEPDAPTEIIESLEPELDAMLQSQLHEQGLDRNNFDCTYHIKKLIIEAELISVEDD